MPHSISNVILHIVFSTKYFRKSIPDRVQPLLHAYIAGTCHSLGSFVYKVGGVDDHIHIACSLPRTMTVADLVQQIKQSSSKWIKTQDPLCRSFRWQNGYAVFSIGYRHIDYLVRYIAGPTPSQE